MTTLPRYALHLPDGRWAYYLPRPERAVGTRIAVYADGDPANQLEPVADTADNWFAGDRHAKQITALYRPRPRTVRYELNDMTALSTRYPQTLSVEDWNERTSANEEYWGLYDAVTEDLDPVEHVYEGPFMPLEGRVPPGPDELQWKADLPEELSQRPEYRHLFPGHIPGLREHLQPLIKAMPRVQYCFVDYQGKPGLHVTVKVPFDQPRTEFRANLGRGGKPLKSGRTVQVMVERSLDLPVPAAVYGPNYDMAVDDWHEQVAFWLDQVKEATVAACSACDGKGYVVPKEGATPASEARGRLSALVTHESDAEAAEFDKRLDEVVAAETAELREQVARVRAWATSHEYRWLHELLDGYGTHGGAL
ncbi:hypothetical protein ACF1AE_21530 [Streptomyces sp. NPDC014986]|uniref:hypothetical protein n=1 Tax=Streptomyces sp. NPDC014986 TaxID=3364934 RepID=UPI0036FD5848